MKKTLRQIIEERNLKPEGGAFFENSPYMDYPTIQLKAGEEDIFIAGEQVLIDGDPYSRFITEEKAREDYPDLFKENENENNERRKEMTEYQKINEAKNHAELGEIVEIFLDSIGQNRSSETYEETANRLRNQVMIDEADVMDYASKKWWELE